MSSELVVSSEATGQKENPVLRERRKARKLKEKEDLSLAEKLILAQSEETISYTYNGIELEIYVPNSQELEEYSKLFSAYTLAGTKEEKDEDGNIIKTDEDSKKALLELSEFVADFFIDDSITADLIEGGKLGVSFIPKFYSEILEYEKRKTEEVTALKGFRTKRKGQ